MKPASPIASGLALALIVTAGWSCNGVSQTNRTPSRVISAGGEPQRELTAEVEWVDTGLQRIEVRTPDGRITRVGYDTRTRVIYRQGSYPVAGLKSGDIVIMRVQHDSYGNPFADLIDLRETAEERPARTATGTRLRLVEGTIEWLDRQRGLFEITPTYGRKFVVSLPYNSRQTDVDRFWRLRAGDYVRVEGRFIDQDRFELVGFL